MPTALYPPLAVLNEILDDVRVALVEIRHRWNKPSIYGFCEINLAGVWVEVPESAYNWSADTCRLPWQHHPWYRCSSDALESGFQEQATPEY